MPPVASLLILFHLQLTFMGLPTLTLLGLLSLEAVALAVAEVIHQILLIFLCLTLTGKYINVDDR